MNPHLETLTFDFLQRDSKRRFLYQIVANEENGVDVDKWDYFARDSHYLGIGPSFDHTRIIEDEMRVCKCKRTPIDEETSQICFRDKVIKMLYMPSYFLE